MVTAIACASPGVPGAQHGAEVSAPAAAGLSTRILVKDVSNAWGVAGARVFVLAQDGRELASALTDESGVALLAVPEESHPALVLVEHESYFIGGLRWRDSAWEYYIELTILAVR